MNKPLLLGAVHIARSCAQMRRIANVPTHDFDEERISPGRPGCGHMSNGPEHQPNEPQTQTQTDGGCQSAVDDRDRSWNASEQNRVSQRPMDWRLKPGDCMLNKIGRHHTMPPALKGNKAQAEKTIHRLSTIS